ncbi:DUF1376 domain-containing protein [Devosia neptuniae]|uniref:DUF1376 domain-containing protein n=1 Tax=Devosia neptuniae TaxID=191302 RepID=A0ABY6CCP7_9HYPH|nr:DUF1376 domain-containing protein [Devosia neptuniae]UXN69925.1 DUF1376 domain-containing protein [Devosia neptuniae]
MAEFPHMPLATDAYLADTLHLDAQQHGAYLMLLIVAWRTRGVPSLPNDDKILARYAKVDPRTWQRIRPTIMAFWELGSDNRWTQKKQLEVRVAAHKRAEAARDKASKRWGPKSLENNDRGDARAVQGDCQADATITNSTIVEKEPNGSLSETAVSDLPKPSRKRIAYPDDFEAAWRAFPTTPNMSKAEALPEWKKLTPDERATVLPSISGYRAFLKADPNHPPIHFCRYLSKRRFEGFASGAASGPEDWWKRLTYARTNKKWSTIEWGPLPGAVGCRAPRELVEPGDGVGWAEWKQRPANS